MSDHYTRAIDTYSIETGLSAAPKAVIFQAGTSWYYVPVGSNLRQAIDKVLPSPKFWYLVEVHVAKGETALIHQHDANILGLPFMPSLPERDLNPEHIRVGMGATRRIGSDCYSYTVTAILSHKRIQVVQDETERLDHNGQSESQEYSYKPGRGEHRTISLRKDGRWRLAGSDDTSSYTLGIRRHYLDPSF